MPEKPSALKVRSARRVLVAAALGMLCAISIAAQGGPVSKRVLMVFTHQADNPAQALVEQAVRSKFQSSEATVEIYAEYLDAVRNPLDGYEKELVAQWQRKYAGKNFDLIFAVNPPALKLLMKNRATLFPGAPVVFLVLDQQNLNGLDLGPNMTGVWGEANYKATLELALSLHPQTKQVAVISGVGDWDNYWRLLVQEELRSFEARVKFSYLTGLTIAELQKELANLPPQTIVLFVSSTRDRAGNSPGNVTVVRQISPASNAPVYANAETLVGLGVVGGRVISFEALGNEAAQVGFRVMAGEKAEAIPPHGVPSVPIFDGRELTRWGISERSLPQGAVVKFKEVSLWEDYKWTIIGLIAAVLVEGLLIAQLLFSDRKRRLAEQQSKRSDRLLREIVSSVPGVVWETVIDQKTKQRKTTFISDYVKTMLGYTPNEWLAQPPGFGVRLMPEEEREGANRETEQAIAKGKDVVSQHRWRAKDGHWVWTETYLHPVMAHNGTPEGLRGVSLDITERKLAEESLQKTEEKARAILAAMPDLMFLQTADGVYLDYHASDKQSLYVSPEEFLGKNMRDTLPPELAEKFAHYFKRATETGEIQIVEYALTLRDGEHWYESRLVTSHGNILSVVRDITERKRSLDQLRESEERFGKAFRSNPQPMSISTLADGVYIDVNDSFLAMSGYSREQVIGHSSLSLGVWTETEKRTEFMSQLIHHGSLSNVETLFRTKNGSQRVLLSSAERVDIGGQDCVLIASSDITERMAAQQALKESEGRYRQMAETAARAHDDLVIAHEEVQRLKDQLEEENIYLQEEIRLAKNVGEMVGESDAIKYVMFKVSHVAVTDSTVLITGETGTGKELVARAIHSSSARSDRALITVNCAALPATLIESELFGHEKGAFTGAVQKKPGRFELADGGTIFLDEVGELPLESQVKLLRVIQEGEVQRLGSSKATKVDVRIIAATNRNLKREIERGAFREDLWYRLNVFPITVPPLRQRTEDIPLLVEHFVAMYANKFSKTISEITPQTMQQLKDHSWPGNIRELANVIERAVIYTTGNVLNVVDVFEQPKEQSQLSATRSLEQVEREYIMHILDHTSWRIEGPRGAAKLLGLNPSTLRTRMHKLGIHKQPAAENH